MHVRLAPRSVIAAVAAAVVLAVLAAPRAAAEEPPAVATVLQPGWNMAAWLGPDAPVQAIFDAVPELELVSAWDAEAQRARRARPRRVLRGGLTRLTTGMGLWLMVGGDAPAEWTREAPPDGVLLELRAGRNIVGWTGRDGIPAAEALARFGEALVAAWHWNAEAGGFERYRPGAPDGTNTLRALRRGDAIAVELASGARWWQSGVWRTTFEFIGNVPEGRQAEIRAETADVLAFFAERYGIVPPEFTVRVHPGLDIAADAAARLIRIGRYAVDDPLIGGTIAHEYTHVLQHSTEGGSSPAWLIEGQATYAGGLFFQSRGDRTGGQATRDVVAARAGRDPVSSRPRGRRAVLRRGMAGLRAGRAGDGVARCPRRRYIEYAYRAGAGAGADTLERIRSGDISWATRRAAPLSGQETYAGVEAAGYWKSRALGFLAAERLVALAGEPAIFEYYRLLPAAADWRAAFAAAFGVAPADFYADFEAYRARIAPPPG